MSHARHLYISSLNILYILAFSVFFSNCSPIEATGPDAGQAFTEDAGPVISVLIHLASEEHSVALSPYAETIDGLQQARIAKLVTAAFPELDLENAHADFLAGDGFMPAHSPNCEALIPVAANSLQQAYVDVDTRALSWDEALQIPGCLYVNDLSEIFLTTP